MTEYDIFLKVDGIEGEVQDPKHKGELRIESHSDIVLHPLTGATGADAGVSTWPDAEFRMWIDKSYPKLFEACTKGDKISKAILTCRKPGKVQQEFLKITFSNVLVSRCGIQGAGKATTSVALPMVSFAFNFSQIEEEYRAQKADGSLSGPINYSYTIPKGG